MRHLPLLAFTLILLAAFSAQAETTRVVPATNAQLAFSYAPLVKSAAPAVVNIYTRKVVQQRALAPLFDDPIFQQFFGGGLPQGLTRQRMENSLGSGVIVRADGLIVTSNHVIAGADQITVVLHDRREFEATLVTTDDRADLALLKIDVKGESLPHLDLKDSDETEVGDLVLAIGNPFGVGQTVTSGIVSALARTSMDINDLNYFIQTDAAINPGNSGGALVTMDGKLVGINAAIYSRSGGNMGIGFAVPSNMVRALIGAVAAGQKKIVRPWCGVNGQAVTAEVASSLNLARPSGLLVNEVHAASPAREAGLKVGDVITAVNGKPVEDPDAFRYRIAMLDVGSVAELEVQRAGQTQKFAVKMIAPPESPPRDLTKVKGRNPLGGATLANMSPAVAEEFGIRGVDKGVIVLKVEDGTPAASLGLRKGDVIARINNADITSVPEALAALQESPQGWHLTLRRGGEVMNVVVRG